MIDFNDFWDALAKEQEQFRKEWGEAFDSKDEGYELDEQWIEDEKQFLEAGDSVYIDADVVHATFNAGEGELEFLAVLSPPEGWEEGTLDVSDREPYASYRSKEK